MSGSGGNAFLDLLRALAPRLPSAVLVAGAALLSLTVLLICIAVNARVVGWVERKLACEVERKLACEVERKRGWGAERELAPARSVGSFALAAAGVFGAL